MKVRKTKQILVMEKLSELKVNDTLIIDDVIKEIWKEESSYHIRRSFDVHHVRAKQDLGIETKTKLGVLTRIK